MSEQVLGHSLEDSDNDNSGKLASEVNDNISYEAFVQENVGEGKKYGTVEQAIEALAKKAAHADTFIETLKLEKQGVETEKEQLAARLAEAKKIDDLMAVLAPDPDASSGNNAQQNGNDGDDQGQQVTQEQLQGMVRDMLQAEKQAELENQGKQKKAENQNKAWESLKQAYGSEKGAKDAIKKYVGTDKSKADIINRMGEATPEAVAEFLKLHVKPGEAVSGVGNTDLNVGEDFNPNKGLLTWKKVQEIRKNDPKLYKDRKFQLQIHKAAASNPHFWN